MNTASLIHLKTGYVILAQSQFLPGYCILIATPTISSLNDLPVSSRQNFLSDMCLIGDAISRVYQPKRINYAILGNKDPYLHAHIIPRYSWEDPAMQVNSIWSYPNEYFDGSQHRYTEALHGQLKQKLIEVLHQLMA